MRLQGQIVEWNDDRGFGFVVANGGTDRLFFHISALERTSERPRAGQIVSYEIATPAGKKPQAVRLRYPGTSPRERTGSARPWGWTPDVVLAGGYLASPAWLVIQGTLPAVVLGAMALMSLAAFIIYGIDKRRARADQWRIPEKTLQTFGLLGGWPGALLAQRLLRHKSSKASYVHAFRFFGLASVAAMLWLSIKGLPPWLTDLHAIKGLLRLLAS